MITQFLRQIPTQLEEFRIPGIVLDIDDESSDGWFKRITTALERVGVPDTNFYPEINEPKLTNWTKMFNYNLLQSIPGHKVSALL